MEDGSRRLRRKLHHAAAGESSSGFKVPAVDTLPRTASRMKRHTPRPNLSLDDLPEDLLCNVISQLTVKEAGRTSILSSRWKNRWICHSNLCFDCSKYTGYTTDRFINHVTHVLQQHNFPVVDRFEVRFPLWKQHTEHVDRWVHFASASRVKHFVLDLSPAVHTNKQSEGHKYEFPVNLLNGQNGSPVVSLRLGLVCLKLPSDFLGFTNLKKLELHLISDLGNINLFLANCHAVEWLSLSCCSLADLNIPIPLYHLQYLQVINCCVQGIESHAMSLTKFEYVGVPVPIKIDNSLKLSQANISLNKGSGNMDYIVNELACSLAHVDGLLIKFSTLDTKVTGFTKNQSQFKCLRHLVLDLSVHGNSKNEPYVLRLTYIVEASPQLEYFVVHMNSNYSGPSTLSITNCFCPVVHHHLKRVHMTGVIGLSGQLELAKYILLSAVALELMTIDVAKERFPHIPWVLYPDKVQTVEQIAKDYLDPRGVYRDVLTVVGIVPSY